MPKVRWSNGQTDTAETWDGLLEHVRRTQWRELTMGEFRNELAKRAYRWTLAKVNPDLPAEELFQELEYAKLIEIIRDDEKED